ncbi:MAG: hypothetical protein ACRC32_03385 [Chroococcidiopsis sp.]
MIDAWTDSLSDTLRHEIYEIGDISGLLRDRVKSGEFSSQIREVARDAIDAQILHARSSECPEDQIYSNFGFWFIVQENGTRIYRESELRELSDSGFEYAALWLIEGNFSNEFNSNDPESPLLGIPHNDFYEAQQDSIKTWKCQLDHLGIDYSAELQQASIKLTEIVNNFVSQWGSEYSLEQCFQSVNPESIYYLMVGSALGHGIGLWEELDQDRGSYQGSEDYIDCYDLLLRVKQAYTED